MLGSKKKTLKLGGVYGSTKPNKIYGEGITCKIISFKQNPGDSEELHISVLFQINQNETRTKIHYNKNLEKKKKSRVRKHETED
jgi:hypothetical protein